MDIIRVSATSRSSAVAGAIAGVIRGTQAGRSSGHRGWSGQSGDQGSDISHRLLERGWH